MKREGWIRSLLCAVQESGPATSLRRRFHRFSSSVREIKVASISGIFLASLLLDFSVWFPTFCKALAIPLQAGGIAKLVFEERYLLLRYRHFSLKKRLIPIVLFAVALLFYLEKGLLFLQIWKDPAGALIHTYRLYSIIFFGSAFSIYAMRLRTIAQFLDRLPLKPAQTLAVSFALLIFFRALFLSLPQTLAFSLGGGHCDRCGDASRVDSAIVATRVIFVEDEMGRRLGKSFCGNAVLDSIELSSTHSIIQWEIPERLTGKSLAELGLETEWNLTLIALKKKGNPPTGSRGRREAGCWNFTRLPTLSSLKETFWSWWEETRTSAGSPNKL